MITVDDHVYVELRGGLVRCGQLFVMPCGEYVYVCVGYMFLPFHPPSSQGVGSMGHSFVVLREKGGGPYDGRAEPDASTFYHIFSPL